MVGTSTCSVKPGVELPGLGLRDERFTVKHGLACRNHKLAMFTPHATVNWGRLAVELEMVALRLVFEKGGP